MSTPREMEETLTERFYAMTLAEQEAEADEFFVVVNALRNQRFNVPCLECEDCGLVHPIDDLSLVTFRGGQRLPVCVKCQGFNRMVRALFGRAA